MLLLLLLYKAHISLHVFSYSNMFVKGTHGASMFAPRVGGGGGCDRSSSASAADQGMTIFVTSNGSLDVCPTNSLDTFQNVFDHPIRLNDHESYQVALLDYSIPAHEAKLYAGDYEGSSVNYNMAVFAFNATSRQYEAVESSVTKLFSLAPHKHIFGLPSEYNSFNIKSPFNDPNMDAIGGSPVDRVSRVNYINHLLH